MAACARLRNHCHRSIAAVAAICSLAKHWTALHTHDKRQPESVSIWHCQTEADNGQTLQLQLDAYFAKAVVANSLVCKRMIAHRMMSARAPREPSENTGPEGPVSLLRPRTWEKLQPCSKTLMHGEHTRPEYCKLWGSMLAIDCSV